MFYYYSHSITKHGSIAPDLRFWAGSVPFPSGSGGSLGLGWLQIGCTPEGDKREAPDPTTQGGGLKLQSRVYRLEVVI